MDYRKGGRITSGSCQNAEVKVFLLSTVQLVIEKPDRNLLRSLTVLFFCLWNHEKSRHLHSARNLCEICARRCQSCQTDECVSQQIHKEEQPLLDYGVLWRNVNACWGYFKAHRSCRLKWTHELLSFPTTPNMVTREDPDTTHISN